MNEAIKRPMQYSAGLLAYRYVGRQLEVFLAHPGGPYWNRKDLACWSLPKGGFEQDEDPLTTAVREFTEEIGVPPNARYFVALGAIQQRSGKQVHAWAFQADASIRFVRSNLFAMEWPKGSGEIQDFPEIDRADFFSIRDAKVKIIPAQSEFLDRLRAVLKEL